MATWMGKKPGSALSERQLERVTATGYASKCIAAAQTPFPGGFFTYPEESISFLINLERHCFTWVTETTGESDLDPSSYLGQAKSDEEFLNLLADFIVSFDLEATAALHLVEWSASLDLVTTERLKGIMGLMWFRLEGPALGLRNEISRALVARSPVYRTVLEFVTLANSQSVKLVLDSLNTSEDFESVYFSDLKYKDVLGVDIEP